MIFGVSRAEDKEHIKKQPHCDEVLIAVKKINPDASAGGWWEARMTMHSPAADWRKPEILWRMHTDGKFLNDVAKQLLEVAEISEPIIDRLVLRK